MKKTVAVIPTVIKATIPHPAFRSALDQARSYQDAIVLHACGYAAARIAYGLELIRLKELVREHSFNWMGFYRDNLERSRFSYETAAEHMRVAKAFAARLKAHGGTGNHLALLEGPKVSDEDREAFIAAVAAVTTATTWTQLNMDLGLVKADEPRKLGGYHAPRHLLAEFAAERKLPTDVYAEWSKETQQEFRDWRSKRSSSTPPTEEQQRVNAKLALNKLAAVLNEYELGQPTWLWLTELDRRALAKRLEDLAAKVRHNNEKGGARR